MQGFFVAFASLRQYFATDYTDRHR